MLGQEEDILAPLAQRGQVHAEDVEAVVEVLAERPRRHRLRQVLVGGGDDPDVGPEGRGAPHALELVLLEHPEELGLDMGGSSPTSSRKSVPPAASSKRPGLGLSAPVKAPFSWPNSSDSTRVSGRAAQLRAMKGPSARGLAGGWPGPPALCRSRSPR